MTKRLSEIPVYVRIKQAEYYNADDIWKAYHDNSIVLAEFPTMFHFLMNGGMKLNRITSGFEGEEEVTYLIWKSAFNQKYGKRIEDARKREEEQISNSK